MEETEWRVRLHDTAHRISRRCNVGLESAGERRITMERRERYKIADVKLVKVFLVLLNIIMKRVDVHPFQQNTLRRYLMLVVNEGKNDLF